MRSRSLLLVGNLISAGCEKQKPDESKQPDPARTAGTATGGTTSAGTPGPTAAGALQGTIGGKPFVPDNIIFEGRTLSFRKGKDFFPEMEVKFDLPAGKLEGKEWRFEGDKFENPTVIVNAKNSDTGFNWPKDYTLALKVTKESVKVVEGTIDLKANQPANTSLRGSFVAVRKKSADDPLEADDAPYVHGKIAITGPWTQEDLSAGFVGKGTDGKGHSNMIGFKVSADGGGHATSTTFEPQLTSLTAGPKGAVTYRHTRVPPGEYLVYAKRNRVMAAWQKVTLKAGDQITADLTIDPSKAGEVVVTLPDAEANEEFAGSVSLVPVDLPVAVGSFHFAFDAAEVKAGEKTVTVKGVPAGKYRVARGRSKGEVEVAAGKSVAVTLVRDEPKKK